MGSRIDFQFYLENLLGPNERVKVYFHPPPSLVLSYPCVVYSRDGAEVKRANNSVYDHKWLYQVTVIDKSPESKLVTALKMNPKCDYVRSFQSDQLNHDIFNTYF